MVRGQRGLPVWRSMYATGAKEEDLAFRESLLRVRARVRVGVGVRVRVRAKVSATTTTTRLC